MYDIALKTFNISKKSVYIDFSVIFVINICFTHVYMVSVIKSTHNRVMITM